MDMDFTSQGTRFGEKKANILREAKASNVFNQISFVLGDRNST